MTIILYELTIKYIRKGLFGQTNLAHALRNITKPKVKLAFKQ